MNQSSASAHTSSSTFFDSSNQSRLPSASATNSFARSFSLRLAEDDGQSSAESFAPNFDRLPFDQLLQNEWFHQNISQMLNISVDNLTTLLFNAQHLYNTATNSSSGVYGGVIVMREPRWLLITLTTFYALIFAAGILGNLITCIVISRIKFMHTATNFYLFNLAVSDLILLLSGMPQELYNTWYPEEYPFNDVLCKLEGIFSETAANATVLTITAFTVERYIAICHPFRQHTMSKLSRAIKFIFAIWVAAFLLALPQAMQFSVVPQNNGLECTMENDFFAHVFAVSGFIFFGGPMTAICVLYVLIGMKLKRSRLLQSLPRRCYDVNRGISAQSRVIRMLVAVAVAFFLCWAPFHAQRLMAAYGSTADVTSALFNRVYHVLNYISGVLYFLSTCINPLLYNIMSHKFREAFKVTLARKFGLNGTYSNQNHRYSTLLRQNGSMRINTTVNTNAFEQLNSFRVVQLQCRDPTHHLSLQDSIRTTTTTTTINSGCSGSSGASNSCRSSQRNRGISNGSQQSALLQNSLKKNDGAHRHLQTQISQLSSMGDAGSLLETDDIGHSSYHPHTHAMSYRFKEFSRNSIPPGNQNGHNVRGSADLDCYSLNEEEKKLGILANPVAPEIMAATLMATQPVQPLNSIAELMVVQPSRSRLKMSRIVTRRRRDVLVTQTNPRFELMYKQLPGMGHQQLPASYKKRRSYTEELFDSFRRRSRQQQESHPKRNASTKTINSLAERFRWRRKRGKGCVNDDGADDQHSRSDAKAAATHTSTPASMHIVYQASSKDPAARNDDGDESSRRNGSATAMSL